MSDPGADYRAAKAALKALVQAWADAEQAFVAWLKTKRGVPRHLLYDTETGEPLDPELVELEAAVDKAHADQLWVRGLIVACGEAVKGRPFAEVVASQGPRPSIPDFVEG